MIVSRAGDPDRNTSVWVRACRSLLNRARSPGGAGYIRIEAVSSAVNQAWGRLLEKAASNPAFFANQNRLRRTLSWTICAKLANRFPPDGPNDLGGINQLATCLDARHERR